MNNIKTVKIKIWGIVQGVGFRPFVAKMADRFGMKGQVLNIGGLVDILITDSQERIESFIFALKKEKPLPAEIVHIKIEEVKFQEFQDFTILDSDNGDDEAAMIPADLSICPDCLAELQNPDNPRYMHPFISCMVCGPRYTIIDKIPYDRENTSMNEFQMCEFCNGEYTDRKDRRYHAQTISCHECGPMLLCRPDLENKDENTTSMAANLLIKGNIIGLKGVGGYNLLCSPKIEATVKSLRKLKAREEKPFAVMFKDINQIKEYCNVSEEEEKLIVSSAKPIVLLERKASDICSEVYRTSRYIGAFLPSMGIQFMLLHMCGPLIVTSANLSDMPIIKDEKEMFEIQDSIKNEFQESNLLPAVFYNERKIRVRLDDSVVRVIDRQPQIIRRSKGYAPVPLYINQKLSKEQMIFSTGGQLKSAFSLSKGQFAYVSQYFGDLDSNEIRNIYTENLDRMKELFRIKPKLVVSDLHPLYFTTEYGEKFARENNIEIIKVQHHHAHVASVIAEHDLQDKVIGVSFDGTGYGTDGAIWGGEFLVCNEGEFQRAAHLEYVKMIGGDSSMKEGWKSAYSYIYHYFNLETGFDEPEDSRWKTVKAGLAHNINTIKSSSMGRLFDGFAAFIEIHDQNRYEGECAIILENYASKALNEDAEPLKMDFEVIDSSEVLISAKTIFEAARQGLTKGIKKERIALGFHYAVANMILKVCNIVRKDQGINTVALTGGVFQNKVLMERTLELLRNSGFEVYYNISVGPNDGGICLGQNYLGMKYLTKK